MADQAPTVAEKVTEYARERLAEARGRSAVLRAGPEPSGRPSMRRTTSVDGRKVALPVDEDECATEVAAIRARRAESEARRVEAGAELAAYRRATESERLERWPEVAERERIAARARRGAI